MAAHHSPKTRCGVEQVPDPIGMNHPSGKRTRLARLAPLARADQANQPYLIDPETGAARLVVTQPTPCMLLKPSDERGEAADGLFSFRVVELPCKLRGNQGYVTVTVLPNSQGPPAKRPNDQCFRRLKFQHGRRPRGRYAMCGWIGQDHPPCFPHRYIANNSRSQQRFTRTAIEAGLRPPQMVQNQLLLIFWRNFGACLVNIQSL
jgi:hypothetical protein